MKRVLVGLMVLILALSLKGAALAAGPPKSLCFKWDPFITTTSLTLKNNGNVKNAGAPVKFSTVEGEVSFPGSAGDRPGPVSGSAHMIGTVLHFSISTFFQIRAGDFYQLLQEGTFDTALGTGSVTFAYVNIPGTGVALTINNRQTVGITQVDCNAVEAFPLSDAFSPSDQPLSEPPAEGVDSTGLKR